MGKFKKDGVTPKNSGGKRREGVNQTSKPFKLNNSLLEDYEGVENKNALINELLANHFSGFVAKIGGLALTQKGDSFFINDTATGELWEVKSLQLEMSLRSLF